MKDTAPQQPSSDLSNPSPAPSGEERFRALAETAHDAIFFTDQSGNVVFWNRAAETMFGYRADEMAGRHLATIVPPRLRDAHERGIERALSGNLPVSGKTTEITGLGKDGREFPLELTLATWESGEARFLTAIARDITGRRRAEEELRQSEERYRSLFEESPIALWEQDFSMLQDHFDSLRARGTIDLRRYFTEHPETVRDCLNMIRVIDVNREAMELFEAKGKGELLGGLERVVGEEARGDFVELLTALAGGGRVIETESVTLTLSGKRKYVFLRWLVAPGPGSLSGRLLLSVIDLTARKKLEAQLLLSQKMEAIGHLAGGVAHDFNNLLAAITMNLELILTGLPQDEELAEAVSVISQTTGRAGRLIHQLLDLSRREKPVREALDLNISIEKLSALLPHLLGGKIQCSLRLAPDLLPTVADPGQLEQVILNLIVNARDAMPEGGGVTISTANVELGADEAKLMADFSPGSCVTVAVSDTGPGISPEHVEHIFEPFFTTRKDGTGLGLSTVYEIIRSLGGHVDVASRPGEGSTFTVTLPSTSK